MSESTRIITLTLNPTLDRILRVPGLRVGEHLVGELYSCAPAGKAINVARALACRGIRCTAMGWVGRSELDQFEQSGRAQGYDTLFTPIAGATRQNITLIDPAGPTETHIRDRGPLVSPAEIDALNHAVSARVSPGSVVVVTGSLAPGLAPDALALMLAGWKQRGARIAVDTSGECLRRCAELDPWLLKPNLQELGELLGRPIRAEADIVNEGRGLSRRMAYVVITAGAGGAYGFHDDRAYHAKVELPADRVRSTVGCGDTFLAGLVGGLTAPRANLEDALRQATAMAAASACSPEPAVFDPDQVDALGQSVTLRRLD